MLSNVAFKFNLRHFTMVRDGPQFLHIAGLTEEAKA
jgi:hypothetical protein